MAKADTHEVGKNRLEPLTPSEAYNLWRESKIDEFAQATMETQSFHLEQFTEWLEAREIDDMRDLTGRTVHRFKLDIKSDLAQSTLAQRVSTVVRFLEFCASIDAVPPHVPEQIELPKRQGDARTESLEPEQAEAALQALRKFAYASAQHALLGLTWHTGLRSGTLRALDVGDFEPENDRLRIRHRPETDTPLKNGEIAERYVTLGPEITEVLSDWIEHNRPDVTDEHGRTPLFATENGRAPVKTLRRWFRTATRPCNFGGDCPHGKDPSECRAAQTQTEAYACPSTVSGHPVRRGAITQYLRSDVPPRVVSDRMNVSQDILDEHYDVRSEDEKAEQRREYLNNV